MKVTVSVRIPSHFGLCWCKTLWKTSLFWFQIVWKMFQKNVNPMTKNVMRCNQVKVTFSWYLKYIMKWVFEVLHHITFYNRAHCKRFGCSLKLRITKLKKITCIWILNNLSFFLSSSFFFFLIQMPLYVWIVLKNWWNFHPRDLLLI